MAKKINIRQELARLEQLRTALLSEEARQTNDERIKELAAAQPNVQPGTPQMEALLMAGYNMSIETAERIIKEREADPTRWPLERFELAQAMLAAYHATPVVMSDTPAWHRTRGR